MLVSALFLDATLGEASLQNFWIFNDMNMKLVSAWNTKQRNHMMQVKTVDGPNLRHPASRTSQNVAGLKVVCTKDLPIRSWATAWLVHFAHTHTHDTDVCVLTFATRGRRFIPFIPTSTQHCAVTMMLTHFAYEQSRIYLTPNILDWARNYIADFDFAISIWYLPLLFRALELHD